MKTIQRQEELLQEHLIRLMEENDQYERLSIAGAKLLKRYLNVEEKYLDLSGNLKPEYLVYIDTSISLISLLHQAHRQETLLNQVYGDIFTHINCFANPPVLAKSILDNRVHAGKYLTPNVSAKYDVYINNIPFEYTYRELYHLECRDTLNLQINILTINHKTFEIDTTIVREQLIVSSL